MFPAPGALQRVIHIEPLAPAKPLPGAVCNGCGVCCLAEPCPAGMLLTRRRRGRCELLRWDAQATMYRCGLVGSSQQVARVLREIPPRRRRLAPWLQRWLAPLWSRLSKRWIGAGVGCDCSLDVVPSRTMQAASTAHHSAINRNNP